jgi:hypothetical protein
VDDASIIMKIDGRCGHKYQSSSILCQIAQGHTVHPMILVIPLVWYGALCYAELRQNAQIMYTKFCYIMAYVGAISGRQPEYSLTVNQYRIFSAERFFLYALHIDSHHRHPPSIERTYKAGKQRRSVWFVT